MGMNDRERGGERGNEWEGEERGGEMGMNDREREGERGMNGRERREGERWE